MDRVSSSMGRQSSWSERCRCTCWTQKRYYSHMGPKMRQWLVGGVRRVGPQLSPQVPETVRKALFLMAFLRKRHRPALKSPLHIG